MKRKILLTLIGLFFVLSGINAQVNLYSFAQTSGTYTPITGGTQVIANASADSDVFGSIPIGFNFVYNGTTYTQIGLNVNGWISLGGTVPVNSSTAISSGTTNNVIAALNRDLQLGFTTVGDRTLGSNVLTNVTSTAGFVVGDLLVTATGFPAGTTITSIGVNTITVSNNATTTGTAGQLLVAGEIRYETIGTAPNQTLVVQWTRTRRFGALTTSGRNTFYNFQIRLSETTNQIDVVYGPCVTNTTTSTFQIGLRGASSADFNNRTTTTDWSATTAGATNTATCTMTQIVFPASGQTYTWLPPVPCAGAPSAGTVGPVAAICDGQTTNMTSTGASSTSGVSGLSFQWQSSAIPGGPYTNVVGGTGATTTSYTTPALTAGTYYYVLKAKCSTGPDSSYSNEISVVVNSLPTITSAPPTGTYCSPGGTGVDLTAGGGVSYTWLPAAGLSSTTGSPVTATPAVTTTYTVTGTDGNGCTNTATSMVSVVANPQPVATATPPAVCFNGNSMLVGTTGLPAVTYCQPTYSSGTGFGDYVGTVQLNTLDNTTAGAAAPYYTLFPATGLTTTTLVAGNNYTIILGAGTYGDNDLAAWIDYNQNGVLNDAGEKLGETDGVLAAPATTSFNFTVPLTAFNGTTRLRVRDMDHGGVNDMDPCAAQSSFGETEDYIITITGGVDPVTFSWSPGTFLNSTTNDTALATGITATTSYVWSVTNQGCTNNDTVTITTGASLTSNALVSNSPVCAGADLIVTAQEVGGGGPYTYKWDYGSGQFTSATGTLTINTIPAGSYILTSTILDFCGDSTSQTTPITINANPVVGVTPTSATYCTPGLGVDLNASGADTYTWGPAAGLSATTGATVTATPASATTYTVTGTESVNGCTATATAVINNSTYPTSVSATATPNSVCLNGSSTLIGTATLAIGAYCQPTYSTGTGFGDYISSVQLNTLNNPSGASATPYYTLYPAAGSTTTTLVAGNNYTIILSPGTYTSNDLAAWIDFNQNGTLNNPGEKLGETDNVGATPATTSFNFTVPLTALNGPTRLRVRDVDHGGTNDMDPCLAQSSFGETEDYIITITGGIDPVTYTWTPGTFLGATNNDTAVATNMTATTTYSFIVDHAGCPDTATVTVTVDPVNVTLDPVNIMCNGDSTGSFTLGTVNCGTPSFDYSVNGGPFGPIPTNLPAGTHSVIVRDATMAVSSPIDVTITEPSYVPDVPIVVPSNVNLCVGDTSAIFVIPSSGTLVVSFDVASQPIETNAAPGNVVATATMPALPVGVTITSATLSYPNMQAIGNSWMSDINLGFGGAVNDPADADPAAGIGAGTFNYTRNITPASINPAGGSVDLLYWDFISDNAGDDATFPLGIGVATLTINYTANTFTSADSVSWYDAPVGGTFLGMNDSLEAVGTSVLPNTNTPGTYTFYAEGFYNGCTSDTRTAVTVNVGAYPVVNLGPDSSYCVTHDLDAGNPGMTYVWNDASTTQMITALDTGTYWVDVTSVLGCTTRDSIDLVINPLPVVNLGPDTSSCGSYTLDPGPQYPGSTYLWTDLSSNPTLVVTAPSGDYDVTVTDVNGCSNSDTVNVNVPPITYNDLGPDTTLCTNAPGFTLDATTVGVTYEWQDGSTDPTFFVNLPGIYWCTITNFVGCTFTDTVIVTSVTPIQANIDVNFVTMSSATLDAGSGFSSYLWSTSASSQVITINANGTYYVEVMDANNCITTDTVNIIFSLGVFNPNGTSTMMTLYPNPSTGIFNVAIDNLETTDLTMEVLDMYGRIVYHRYVGSVEGSTIEPFNLTNLRAGNYVLRLTANGRSSQLRFIIK